MDGEVTGRAVSPTGAAAPDAGAGAGAGEGAGAGAHAGAGAGAGAGAHAGAGAGAHIYRTVDVPVAGGLLRVGIWDVDDAAGTLAAGADAGVSGAGAPATGAGGTGAGISTVVLVHGVTSSHLAWQWVAKALPGVRIVAPDLRGRGGSNALTASAGMAAHADDLAAVCAHLGLAPTVVVGHSMGAFVSVVFAHRHPELVTGLVLIDGGFPLAAPEGLTADETVAAILGPTAARLDMRFPDVAAYLDFWREHPAFVGESSPELDRYFAYDLVADRDVFRPATSYATTAADTVDLTTGAALRDALSALRHPVRFVTVPRGLQNEPPGLYPLASLDALLAPHPGVQHERWDGLNHYTVVMSDEGAAAVARVVRAALAP